jgi:signal transduction histidine kinase/ligand-binding sensor domain-containing protein
VAQIIQDMPRALPGKMEMPELANKFEKAGLLRLCLGITRVKFIAVLLFCTLAPGFLSPVCAEIENPYFARTWLAEDGLPDNRVVGLTQTADGYLWVATQAGVVRFDGVRFQPVRVATSPDLIAGTMRALMLDRKGRVWVAKEEGGTLFCFDGPQVRTVTGEKGLPKNETQSSMAMDGNGDLWVSYTTGKIVRYSSDGKVESFTTREDLPRGDTVSWLACGRDGLLWFAKGRSVGVCRDGHFRVLANFGSPALRMAPAHSGGVWVCSGQQLFRLAEESSPKPWAEIVPDKPGDHSGFNPSVLLEDRDGEVLAGTLSAGLFRCDSNGVVRVNVSNPAILSLAEDREGNVWVGTRGGLNRVHRRLTTITTAAEGLPFQGVQSVCQDASGALWLVGENGLLARGQGTNWLIQALTGEGIQPHATCAAASTNGSVWIGAWGGGLYQWTSGKFKDRGFQGLLRQKSPRSLLVTSNGDLWMATDSPDTLYCLHREVLETFALPAGHRFIRAMAEDAAGNLWAGASDGLLVRVTGGTVVDETAKSGSLSIRCLDAKANGDVWIGYAGAGVGRLRNGTITRLSADQGLPNDYVAQILFDDRGSVWFAGNQGIFQVRERDLEEVANGEATRIWPVVYGRSTGLPGLQASFDYWPDSLRGADGRLYFSMLSGLAEVRPDLSRLNYQPPNVLIERVTADDHALAVYQNFKLAASTNESAAVELSNGNGKGRSELRVPAGVQQVQFEFAALSLVAPETVQFRYRLEGLDKNWVEAGTRRMASYTRPTPGSYRFQVTACNNDGIWNKAGYTLAVRFEPYVWETLWFKVAVIVFSFVVLCGMVVLALRRRHRLVVEQLEHERALEAERTRIARDLHDDLGAGLTEIGLLGDLASTSRDLPSASRERLHEMTGRTRALAASLDEIVWAINPANNTSQSLVDYFFPYAQKLLGHAHIRCRLEVVEPLPAGTLNSEGRHEFFHAYKEALNNIIRHSKATEVQISMTAAGDSLMIRVADNGRGLEAPDAAGGRHGLAGMRERLQRLGGRCDIASSPASGTTITFTIPVQSGAWA